MQIMGKNIMIDPMLGTYSSLVQIVGPKRFTTPLFDIDTIEKIDYIVITHDHYDHLDYDSITDLESKTDKFIVPLGVDKHLLRWGIKKNKIVEMAWWEEYE